MRTVYLTFIFYVFCLLLVAYVIIGKVGIACYTMCCVRIARAPDHVLLCHCFALCNLTYMVLPGKVQCYYPVLNPVSLIFILYVVGT